MYFIRMKNQDFYEKTLDVLAKIGLNPGLIKSTAAGISHYYDEDIRSYHTAEHIMYMFEQSEIIGWDDNPILDFAILCHDLYYVPGNKENEFRSAKMAVKILNNSAFDAEDIIVDLIMATSKYYESSITNSLCQKLCDLDLSSIARQPYEDFVYQQNTILHEFGSSDLSKSAEFLKNLLSARGDDIYYTVEGKKAWLNAAKENINKFVKDHYK